MTTVTLSASGAADPAEAWERYARPARWTEWAPQISRVDYSEARLRAGAIGRVHGPLGVFVDFEIDDVDESRRRWSWTVRRGPLRLGLEHSIFARPRGSRTSLRVDGPLPVVLAYAPIAQFALRRLVAH